MKHGPENQAGNQPLDPRDTYDGVLKRKAVQELASPNIDPYDRAFQYVNKLLLPDEHTVVVDVGCSSGEFFINAAQREEYSGYLVGVDVNDEGYWLVYGDRPPPNFRFIQASGDNMPLGDSSVDAVMAHNVLFRPEDPKAMLSEFQRIVKPGGYIFISTNSPQHGESRHGFELVVAGEFSERHKDVGLRQQVDRPAESFFAKDAVRIIKSMPGMHVVKTERYQADIEVTREGMDIYMNALYMGAAEAGVPKDYHYAWRKIMREVAEPMIMKEIEATEIAAREGKYKGRACFKDISDRVLIIVAIE